jgi:hypothetical protein
MGNEINIQLYRLMKTEIVKQINNSDLTIEDMGADVFIEQFDERWIVIEKSNIPELIKILQSFVEIN